MSKLTRLVLLFVALVAVLLSQRIAVHAYPYDSVSCGYGVATGYSGQYCSVNPGDAEGQCSDARDGFSNPCPDLCGQCGRPSAGFDNCSWGRNNSPGQQCGQNNLWLNWFWMTCYCQLSCQESCLGDERCVCESCNQGVWVCEGSVCSCGSSPVLLNLDDRTNDDHLTSEEAGVWFDLTAIGKPQHTSWTSSESPVGFLVLDRDGNGRIDDGEELFGTATVLKNGIRAANGFEALGELDDNRDHMIDRSDSAFGQLKLWIDANHDGASQPDELHSLGSLTITAIGTDYVERKHFDGYGNWYRYEGHATIRGRRARVFDVYFRLGQQDAGGLK